MPDLIMQIVFIICALITGSVFGWWIAHFLMQQKANTLSQTVDHLRDDYETAVEENNRLRKQLKHVEQHRAKAISLLDNDSILATHEELAHSRQEAAQQLVKLQAQEEYIVNLTTQLNNIRAESNASIGSGINFNAPTPTT